MTAINQLHAGAAQIDITPPLGTRINGDFVTHFATQIHDPLYAKCLILQNGHEILAWVIVDICVMSQEFIEPVKEEIHRQTHIPIRNILLASTHTHAAGSIEEVHLSASDMAYRKRLAQLLPEVVVQARDNMRPSELSWGSVQVPEHVLCRRYHMKEDYVPFNPVTGQNDQIKTNPFGLEKWIDRPVAEPDPELFYLAVRGLDGEWISVVGNYSLHYVGDWENGTISADYFGVFARRLKEKLGATNDFVGIMTNGTSGDINIWDFEGKKNYPSTFFDKSKLIGNDIADRLFLHLQDNVNWQNDVYLGVQSRLINQDVRKPSEVEIMTARELVERSNYEEFTYGQEGLEKVYAREQIMLSLTPTTREIPLQAFRIGDLTVGALPGEFFAETGLKLKKSIGTSGYFTICLANGNVGYVPPEHEIELGGYETWRCRYSCLEPQAETSIRNELIKMANAVSD